MLNTLTTTELLQELKKRLRWKRAVTESTEAVELMAEIAPKFTDITIKLSRARIAQSVSGRLSPKG